MPTEVIRRVPSDIVPGDHPYLRGAWTPLHEEVNATDMRVLAVYTGVRRRPATIVEESNLYSVRMPAT